MWAWHGLSASLATSRPPRCRSLATGGCSSGAGGEPDHSTHVSKYCRRFWSSYRWKQNTALNLLISVKGSWSSSELTHKKKAMTSRLSTYGCLGPGFIELGEAMVRHTTVEEKFQAHVLFTVLVARHRIQPPRHGSTILCGTPSFKHISNNSAPLD